VPVCYALAADEATHGRPIVYTPLDEKRKRVTDPHRLARVRDLIARPQVTLPVDRWDENWRRLGWLRLEGAAVLLEPAGDARPEHAAAVAALRAKYPQYARQDLEARPVIRVAVSGVLGWQALEERGGSDAPEAAG
jgi:PPOX class probable F420-dependent enzyme